MNASDVSDAIRYALNKEVPSFTSTPLFNKDDPVKKYPVAFLFKWNHDHVIVSSWELEFVRQENCEQFINQLLALIKRQHN